MFNRLNGSGRSVPNLVVAQRVIDKMNAAARFSIEDETGEAMIGLVTPGAYTNGVPTIYVLDTISPDESAIRQFHTFQQGDDRQDELIWWLQENWQQSRTQQPNPKWDVPLRYLGDWHKQPGFMIQPSGGDLLTALDWLDDSENGMDFLLAPIVTLGHPYTTGMGATTNFLMTPQPDGTALRVDFWYIDNKTRLFVPLTPALYPNAQLPTLVEYPWHIINDGRFAAEMRALEDDDLFISMTLWEADDVPPLEICFLTARMGAEQMLILITSADYPQTPPRARSTPFIQMNADDDMYDVFANAWANSAAVEFTPEWSAETMLLDYVRAVEAHLGWKKPASDEAAGEH